MTDLQLSALKQARAFGGHALDDFSHIVYSLEGLGFVEVNCKTDDGIGYSLTEKGRKFIAKHP